MTNNKLTLPSENFGAASASLVHRRYFFLSRSKMLAEHTLGSTLPYGRAGTDACEVFLVVVLRDPELGGRRDLRDDGVAQASARMRSIFFAMARCASDKIAGGTGAHVVALAVAVVGSWITRTRRADRAHLRRIEADLTPQRGPCRPPQTAS